MHRLADYYLLAFIAQSLSLKNCSREMQNSRETPIGGVYY